MVAIRRILIADDEPLFGTTTARFLETRGFTVIFVETGEAAQDVLEKHEVDLIIADLDMPGNRNLELLNRCRRGHPDVPFIVVTGRPTLPSAIEGIRLGIHDYFLKPLDLDDLLHSVHRAIPKDASPQTATHQFSEILGGSAAVQHLRTQAARVARSHANVLIRGESGTGKELLARGIHEASSRRRGPFITVDCGSIPETLIESILFGHARGSFTGATQDRPGLVSMAHGGTLFLDEIGELPLAMQAKLLRVLQFGSFTSVGSLEETKVDVRVIAATHRDLASEVSRGTFRLDLFYRLSVLEIVSPPLRDRIEDVPFLANHMLKMIALRDQLPDHRLATAAEELLKQHQWPGNIRELQNVIERCVCLAHAPELTVDDVRQAIDWVAPNNSTPIVESEHAQFLDESERKYFRQLLQKWRGNVSQAAREAQMSRQGLHKALARLQIDPTEFRAS
jgi:two-component system, NtrC family, response regulator AtoC